MEAVKTLRELLAQKRAESYQYLQKRFDLEEGRGWGIYKHFPIQGDEACTVYEKGFIEGIEYAIQELEKRGKNNQPTK